MKGFVHMKQKEKMLYRVLNFDYFISGASLLVLIAVTFVGVIMRYFLNNPFMWGEEVQLWCFVWVVFFGASAAFRTGSHVAIDVLVDFFPKSIKKIVEVFAYLLVMAVLLYLLIHGTSLINQLASTGRTTNILKVNYSVVYSALPIGCVLMMISHTVSTVFALLGKNDEAEGERQ
jgi:TRAP-type C4-dicarboxylate transport system permease small subunit